MSKTREMSVGVRGPVHDGSLLARLFASRPRRRRTTDFYADPQTGIGREKRRSPRLSSSRDFRLRWREGAEDLDQVGRLVDVSRTGALGILTGLIGAGRRALLSLDGSRPDALVMEVVVLAVEPGQRVRFAFPRPCPTAFLRAAIGETSGGDRPGSRLRRLARRLVGR